MDIRAILKSRGVADDVAESMIGNPAYTQILEGFVADAEAGQTALLNAKKIEADLKEWNDNTVIPYGAKKDAEAREAKAESAKLKTYLSELKAQGYEISDAYVTASTTTPEPKVESVQQRDYAKDITNLGKVQLELISLSNKYRKLTGDELDLVSEYEDFGKNRRPDETLRAYTDRKYDLSGKEAAKEAERKSKYEQGIKDEAVKAAKAEWEQRNGANPETVRPSSSKFDKFKALPDDKKNSWQTQTGREASTIARQEKYRDLLVQ